MYSIRWEVSLWYENSIAAYSNLKITRGEMDFSLAFTLEWSVNSEQYRRAALSNSYRIIDLFKYSDKGSIRNVNLLYIIQCQ